MLVSEELKRLIVGWFVGKAVEQAGEVPARHEDVGPAIIVEISESRAPLHRPESLGRNPCLVRHVQEVVLALVLQQACWLATVAGDEEVELSIAVEIAEIRGHVSVNLTVCAGSGSGRETDLFEVAVAQIVKEIVIGTIVGDKQVRPAVAVVVSPL